MAPGRSASDADFEYSQLCAAAYTFMGSWDAFLGTPLYNWAANAAGFDVHPDAVLLSHLTCAGGVAESRPKALRVVCAFVCLGGGLGMQENGLPWPCH